MTADQKRFCVNNHNLVYSFLRKKAYNIDEYYNVVIIGYIRACQMYSERADLQEKFDFPLIAFMCMRSEISNHFKSENRKCRKPKNGICSLEQMQKDNNGYYEETVSSDVDFTERVIRSQEDKLFLENLMMILSKTQMEIVLYLLEGYKEREIYRELGIKRKAYKGELENIQTVLENYCDI